MRRIENRLCQWCFTIAVAISFLFCITALVLWNISWEKPIRALNTVRIWRVGKFEITDQSNRLSVHYVSEAEKRYADFEKTVIDYIRRFDSKVRAERAQLAKFKWGSAEYQAALQRLIEINTERATHVYHPPPYPGLPLPQLVVDLPIATGLLAILPLIWIVLAVRRNRSRISAVAMRNIAWREANTLTRFQRVRRGVGVMLAITSLALMLLSAFLWARSYGASDQYRTIWVEREPPQGPIRQTDWITYRGAFGVSLGHIGPTRMHAPYPVVEPADYYELLTSNPSTIQPPRWHKINPWDMPPIAALSWGFYHQSRPVLALFPQGSGFVIRFWFVTLYFAIPPLMWVMVHWKRKQKPGHCAACDYDLTANTSGVCPECGAVIGALGTERLAVPRR